MKLKSKAKKTYEKYSDMIPYRVQLEKLYKKYHDVIPYLFFGACTTVVNIGVYAFCDKLLGTTVVISTTIAWFLSVLFAYITNRKWVFNSKASKKKEILREIASFFVCRFATGLVDVLIMYIFVERLHLWGLLFKVLSNVVIVVLNYVASKILIFSSKKPCK